MIWLPLILIFPYIIIILKYFISLSGVEVYKPSVIPSISVSVIVPCHNEEHNLTHLLNSLSSQNYPKDLFEVIVIDDNSTDDTFKTASHYSGIQNISILSNTGIGKKSAIRQGISISESELIITTDADCTMGVNWIKTISSFYQQNRPDMIICPVQIETGNGFFRRFQELEFLSLQGITAGAALSGQAIMCNGANLAFAREMYYKHSQNLHDEINSGDDIFLLQSLKIEKKSKVNWIESPEAIVTTRASSSMNSFLQQRKRWISKVAHYTDKHIIITGIATFVAVFLQFAYLICSLFNPVLLYGFLFILVFKSVPDYLIIRNTARRYEKTRLMRWFLPSQIIYPFYVMMVIIRRK
jgi:cellulose synthase/poly-beta-1,6-N-acetylglucosamine synthase-like glycosyltransferase